MKMTSPGTPGRQQKRCKVGHKTHRKKNVQTGGPQSAKNRSKVARLGSGVDFPSKNESKSEQKRGRCVDRFGACLGACSKMVPRCVPGVFFIRFSMILSAFLKTKRRKTPQQTENMLRIFRALPKQIYANAVRRRCHALRVQLGSSNEI